MSGELPSGNTEWSVEAETPEMFMGAGCIGIGFEERHDHEADAVAPVTNKMETLNRCL